MSFVNNSILCINLKKNHIIFECKFTSPNDSIKINFSKQKLLKTSKKNYFIALHYYFKIIYLKKKVLISPGTFSECKMLNGSELK